MSVLVLVTRRGLAYMTAVGCHWLCFHCNNGHTLCGQPSTTPKGHEACDRGLGGTHPVCRVCDLLADRPCTRCPPPPPS